ncbi:PIN-like domain-containing protein [Streptosporangium sp. NPDC020072]|uniref:PIN-like domain-containing protein n=1 Tax=Streptosporangium sp. NPDC020072 TaxID=3154788 RepID=UPI0034153667
MIAFDTNALFDAYRLNGDARREFLSALQLVGNRLWIPHQVGLEFVRGRLGVVQECVNAADEISQAVERSVKPILRELGKRRGLQQKATKDLEEIMDQAVTNIKNAVSALYQFDVPPHAHPDEDPIFLQLDTLMEGKIGSPPPSQSIPTIEKEGLRRIANKIPPGYKDKHKDDPHALGDYILWEQIILEATKRQLPVLFVTRDAKEDWVWRENGRTQGPRVELVEEMAVRTGQPFYLIDVTSFLRHAATYLSAKISRATLEQADNLSASNHYNGFAMRVFTGKTKLGKWARHRLAELISDRQMTISTATTMVLAEWITRASKTPSSPEQVLDDIRQVLNIPPSRKSERILEAAQRAMVEADLRGREFEFAEELLILLNGDRPQTETEGPDGL